jgi:integrase
MRIPKYRIRPDRDSAFVEFGGKRIPLPGRANSPESLSAYEQIAKQAIRIKKPDRKPPGFLLLVGLLEKYLAHAKNYYFHAGPGNNEYKNICDATKILLEYPDVLADGFSPLQLQSVRDRMIQSGLARSTINSRINKIRRMFRWGVSQELVRPETHQALLSVAGLRKGNSAAVDPPPIAPVQPADVDAVAGHLPPMVADMLQLQRLTGMRSANLCEIRWADIDQSGEVWIYRPPRHKGSHLNKSLAIALGPRCRGILSKYSRCLPGEAIFSPRASEAVRHEAQRSARKTPVQPSQAARTPKPNPRPRGRKSSHYTPATYRRAIVRAIEKANLERTKLELPPIPHWHPHQLRHSVGTLVRKKYQAEAARVYLGHSRLSVTEIYAERDLGLACKIAREMG